MYKQIMSVGPVGDSGYPTFCVDATVFRDWKQHWTYKTGSLVRMGDAVYVALRETKGDNPRHEIDNNWAPVRHIQVEIGKDDS